MITIKKENYFSDSGGKPFNEDSFAYIPGSTYLVCDGNGVKGKGDVASKIVVKSFLDSFRSDPKSLVDDVLIKTEGNTKTAQVKPFYKTLNDGVTIRFADTGNVKKYETDYLIFDGTKEIYIMNNNQTVIVEGEYSFPSESVIHILSK